ncbi:MAG: permease prefix domain 1-containing protein [Pirellulales bacterium]
MSEREFENYLALMARLLRLRGGQREAIARELRDHMEARLDVLLAQGMNRDEAVRIALEEFGDAAGLAGDFIQVARFRKKRWIMRVGIGSVTAAAAMIMAVMAMWPEQQGPLSTTSAVAQDAGQEDVGEGAGQEEQRSGTGNKVLDDAARNAKVMEALSQPTNVQFFETPLEEAITFIGQQHELQFYLDSRALEEVAIPPDSPITLQLSDVSTELMLELMLGDLDLTYQVRGGLVIVTSPEVAEEMMEVRVYDVGDLIASYEPNMATPQRQRPANQQEPSPQIPSPRSGGGFGGSTGSSGGLGSGVFSVPSTGGDTGEANYESPAVQIHAEVCAHCHQVDDADANLQRVPIHYTQLQAAQLQNSGNQLAQVGGVGGIGGGGGAGGFGGAGGLGAPRRRASGNAAMDELIDLITTIVAIDSWQENGGIGTIRAYQSALVIAQTEPVHRKVQDLLEGLRAVVKKNEVGSSAAATATPDLAPSATSRPPSAAPATSRPGGYRPPGLPMPSPAAQPALQGIPGTNAPGTGPAPQGIPGTAAPAAAPFGDTAPAPFGAAAPIEPNLPSAAEPAADPAGASAPDDPFGANPFGEFNIPGAEAPATDAAADSDPFAVPGNSGGEDADGETQPENPFAEAAESNDAQAPTAAIP